MSNYRAMVKSTLINPHDDVLCTHYSKVTNDEGHTI